MADQTDAGRPAAQESFVTVEEVLRARLGTVFGGWRGAVESAVPTVLFVVVWNVTSDIPLAALSALAAAVVIAGITWPRVRRCAMSGGR